MNIPVSTIGDMVRFYKKNGLVVPDMRTGKPKVFTERTKSVLYRAFRVAPFAPIVTQYQRFIAGGSEMLLANFTRRIKELIILLRNLALQMLIKRNG